jgi:hypothetical protein
MTNEENLKQIEELIIVVNQFIRELRERGFNTYQIVEVFSRYVSNIDYGNKNNV